MSDFALPQLVQALTLATSTSDTTLLARANEQLDAWDALPEFWEALVRVALDRQLASEVPGGLSDNARRLAAIRVKNGLTRYWRQRIARRSSVTIDRERKARIRALLLGMLEETDRTVALESAVAVARVARLDYPDEWPVLLPTLQDAIVHASAAVHTGDAAPHTRLVLLRSAEALHHTLKELETMRVLSGKVRMSEVARTLLPPLQAAFEQLFAGTLHGAEQDAAAWAAAPGRAECIRAVHLLLKALGRLALADMGILSARRGGAAADGTPSNLAFRFFACTPAQLQRVAWARSQVMRAGASPLLTPLTKLLIAYAKLHLALVARQNSNAARWPGWAEVAWWYWHSLRDGAQDARALERPDAGADESGNAVAFPYKWLVCALVLLRTTLLAWKHARPADTPFYGAPGAQFEREAVDVLLDFYLRLTPGDLARWEESAEEFALQDAQADADLDVRPAAESLLLALARHSTRRAETGVDVRAEPKVAEYVWTRFQAAAQLAPDELGAVLARDAVYLGAGVCRDELDPALGEHELGEEPENVMSLAIEQRLVPEAALDAPRTGAAWVVVRRRIAWLLWHWSEQVRVPARPAVYALLAALLQPVPGKTDAAVRLQAAKSVTALADTLTFDADVFAPYLGDALAGLVQLVGELEEVDSIRTVATALSVVTERVGPRVVPYVPQLVDMVPALWGRDDPEARARPSILEFLGKLTREASPALGDAPGGALAYVHHMVATVVRDALSPANAPLLAGDALLLWARTLQAAPQMTAPAFELLALLPPLLPQPDHVALACRILEESCLLAPLEVLREHGAVLAEALAAVLLDKTFPDVLAPVYALECWLRTLAASEREARDAALHYFAEQLHRTRLFEALLLALLEDREATVVASQFVCVVCRLAFELPYPVFPELVHTLAPVLRSVLAEREAVQRHLAGAQPGAVWPVLVPELVRRAGSMPAVRKMKMVALGLASMVRSAAAAPDAPLFECIPEMIGVWTDVLGQVVEDAAGNASVYRRELSPDRSLPQELVPEDEEFGLTADTLGGGLENTLPNARRSHALLERDPVTTVPLRAYIAETLNEALARHPSDSPAGATLHGALSSMDPLVLEVLQKDLAGERPRPEDPEA